MTVNKFTYKHYDNNNALIICLFHQIRVTKTFVKGREIAWRYYIRTQLEIKSMKRQKQKNLKIFREI